MFWDDIVLVTEQIGKHGLRAPFADLGGMERPCVADYDLTVRTGIQEARYISLQQRPFDHIDPDYLVLNPDKGDPYIESLPERYPEAFGTAVCLNVLEHVENPFEVFEALFALMKPDSLLIVETVFSFPYHPSPADNWRFTPDCLRMLGTRAGFSVLECDWRLHITPEMGIRRSDTGGLQEVQSVYSTFTKDGFEPREGLRVTLPRRISDDPRVMAMLSEDEQ